MRTIPLHDVLQSNQFIWAFTPNKNLSIKTTYVLLKRDDSSRFYVVMHFALCHMEHETIIHMLRDYVNAKLVWQDICRNLPLIQNLNEIQVAQSSIQWRKLFIIIINDLWQTRNKILLTGKDFNCQIKTWQNVLSFIGVTHQVNR
ncbi:hypothetical protein CR513_61492, partial [Mucuna pruriens]